MSIRIIKNGLLDTVQDRGRYGYQHLGINPGGVMDPVAMRVANALTGNDITEAVLEMHFPAAEMVFEETALIALTGADFAPTLNGESVPLLQPLLVEKGVVLRFTKQLTGARAYLAVAGGFQATNWLNSYSTHLKVKAGGFEGRALRKDDRLVFKEIRAYDLPNTHGWRSLPWTANVPALYRFTKPCFIAGAEFDWLTEHAQQQIHTMRFTADPKSDRMGYRLRGEPLQAMRTDELLSTAVTRGTMQLLPGGQLIILMADHQTTGGYPRIGHIAGTSIPFLAQLRPGENFSLEQITISEAEKLQAAQERDLQQLQNACNFRLQEYFDL
ncbi:MAG: biotin-dependent carboxyltransferase family protein [Sediminibacterium sp.]|nr:biotin-dependent carboxyltransferase family protein [Sediminibacterium sp.]